MAFPLLVGQSSEDWKSYLVVIDISSFRFYKAAPLGLGSRLVPSLRVESLPLFRSMAWLSSITAIGHLPVRKVEFPSLMVRVKAWSSPPRAYTSLRVPLVPSPFGQLSAHLLSSGLGKMRFPLLSLMVWELVGETPERCMKETSYRSGCCFLWKSPRCCVKEWRGMTGLRSQVNIVWKVGSTF